MKCDARTFAQMYETVYSDLYRFALCLMRNPQDAEDAVGEAVLKAYENVKKLKNPDSFRSWIFTITANTCRKKLKTSKQDTFTNEAAEEKDYEMSMDVKRAFFILSEEEQTIIGLSVFGGYNSKEIGKIMGLNANTVRSKRKRALEKMECVLS